MSKFLISVQSCKLRVLKYFNAFWWKLYIICKYNDCKICQIFKLRQFNRKKGFDKDMREAIRNK
jgi:hypothetical protein